MKKFYSFLFVLAFLAIVFAQGANAQVSVTGNTNITPILNATYGSLASAITALNSATSISGQVIITLTGNETAPAGGYSITAIPTGASATNNIIIQGSGSTITASASLTVGALNDAIFKIIGADYITIQNFTMQENAANTVITPASNTMTEWGVALLYASATNGAQYNTIQNNTISLNKTYTNTWGIYSNVRHTATAVTTTADITNATGSNSNNKVYGNTISNVNMGIAFIGCGATSSAAYQDAGNDIGGSSLGTGNTISNWGGLAAASSYVSNSGTSYCIFINHQTGENVSYNTLTSAAVSGTAVTFVGIRKDYSSLVPIGTFTTNITNNTITMSSGFTSGTFQAILSQGMTALSTATININYNNIISCAVTGASSSSSIVGIVNSSVPGVLSISNNIIRSNTSTATTGGFTGISNTGAVVTTININNNQIGNATGGAITFSAATSGAILCINNSGAASTSSVSVQSNDIRGLVHSVAGSSAHTYITSKGTPLNNTISNNTFTNMSVNTTGSVTFISHSYSMPATGTQTIDNNNIVTAFNKTGAGGTVTVTTTGGSSPNGSVSTVTNNNFSNITVTGATGITGITNTDGSGSSPTKICTGNTFNNWTGGSSALLGINYGYIGATTSSISNNTLTNWTGTGAMSGITIGSSFGGATTLNVTTNTINNLVSSGTGGNVKGLTCSNNSTTININNNPINTLSSTGASTVSGIEVNGATTTNVFKNKIYDLSGSNASTTVNGILVSAGTTINVYNNLVGDLRTTAANAANPLIGLSITGGTTVNAYYNSVYLNGTSAGALFGSSAVSVSTTPTVTLRNNIFVNTSIPNGATGFTVAYRRSSTTLTTYGASSNNNDFYAGTPGANNLIHYDGTNSFQTMASYKTMTVPGTLAPRDNVSFSENPTWQSTTGSSANFLKFSTTVATQIESGATNITGITDDYFNTIRFGNAGSVSGGTAPDVGAWCLEGIGLDLIAPAISYTAPSNTLCVNNITISAAITDASGVNGTAGTRPRIYFKKSGDANNYVGNTSADNGWKYVEASNGATPFSLTTNFALLQTAVTAGDVINYFVVAQDNAGTPNVGINAGTFTATPASVALTSGAFPVSGFGTYSVLAGVPTSITIGAAGTYTSLTGAGGLFAAINAGGLTANTTVLIMDASVTETGANALNQIAYGCSGPYTLTIKPNTTATLTGSVASGSLIKLNGADYVIIDGSNSGGTDRSLTITNSNTTSPTAVSLVSLGTGAGATNNTIKNCNISTGISAATGYGIAIGGNTPGTGGADNDNVTIQNNNITVATVSIYANGTASVTSGGDDALLITGNTVNSNTTIQNQGIQVGNALSSTISLNTVSVTSSGTVQPVGISLETGFVNSTVNANTITSALASASGGYGGRGITVGTGTASSSLTISNNLIYGVNGSNWSSFGNSSSMGICIGTIGGSGTLTTTSGGINLYYNSVNMSGSMGSGSTTAITTALYVGSGASALDIRDNIFANTQVGTSTTQKNYAIYSAVANTAFTTINFNDYYVTNTFNAASAILGFLSSDRTDLAGIIAGFGGNANSISANPLWASNTDLRPGSTALQAGTPVSVTVDFTNATRSGSTPTMGAYENLVDLAAPVMAYTNFTNTSLTSDRILSVTITDLTGVPTTGALQPRIYYKKGAGGTWFSSQGVKQSGTATNGIWNVTIVVADMGGVAINDVVYYFTIAQDLVGTPNIGSNPAAGLVATDVNTVTTPPTTPNTYTITGAPLSGIYDITGVTLFNKITGKNLTTKTFTRKVMKEVPIEESLSLKKSKETKEKNERNEDIKNEQVKNESERKNNSVKTQLIEVEEEYSVLYEGDKVYDGPLFISKEEIISANKNVKNGNEIIMSPNADGTYATITAAVTDLNLRGVGGATTFNLIGATYNAAGGETFPIIINSVSGMSATNTLTIKPAVTKAPTISGSVSSGALIKIYNTNYVTIDGSNTVSGTTRDLTITNTSVTLPRVIWMGSNGTTPITNVTVKNSNIINGLVIDANAPDAVIVCDGTTLENAGYFNNVTIQNNNIKMTPSGITGIATVASGNGSGLLISGNNLNSTGTDAIGYIGIYVQGVDGATVAGNTIANFDGTTSGDDAGIWLATGTKNSTIEKNNINTIGYTGTSGYGAYGIKVSTGVTGAAITLKNNVIYNIFGDGYDYTSTSYYADNPMGINLDGTQTGISIYFNSINLYGNTMNNTSAMSMGIFLGTGSVADIKNNVIVNNLGINTIGYGACGIYAKTNNAQFTDIDYNDYYVNATGSGVNAIGKLSTTTTATNLTQWRSATSKDQFSVNGDPGFTSTTDLTPNGANPNSWNIKAGAYPLASVTIDYNGVSRNTSVSAGPEDIGAYKFATSVDPNPVTVSGSYGNSNTTILSFAGTTIATITWHSGTGTLPTGISAVFKPGANPPGTPVGSWSLEYLNITPTDGALPYTYDITLYYNLARTFNISVLDQTNLRVAKYSSVSGTWAALMLNTTTSTANKTVTVTGIDNGFSSFNFTGADAPNPVVLSSFTSNVSGRDVKLQWTTALEINNSGFEIERKVVGSQNSEFKKISFVSGNGTKTTPTNYSFDDRKLNTGKYNYRLKQVDNNGNFEYHNLSTVIEIGIPTKYDLSQNYPNPFNPTTKIDYALPFDSKVSIILYDITGREVKTLVNNTMKAGFYTDVFNLSNLSSGTYFYRLIAKSSDKDYVATKKMVLVK